MDSGLSGELFPVAFWYAACSSSSRLVIFAALRRVAYRSQQVGQLEGWAGDRKGEEYEADQEWEKEAGKINVTCVHLWLLGIR